MRGLALNALTDYQLYNIILIQIAQKVATRQPTFCGTKHIKQNSDMQDVKTIAVGKFTKIWWTEKPILTGGTKAVLALL